MVYEWLRTVHHWIYPPTCILCGADSPTDLDLCPACHADLPWNRHRCALCALPLPEGSPSLCGPCRRRPPPFAASVVPLLYRDPVDRLLPAFKFRQRIALARPLGELLATAVGETDGRPEAIVPVPLHPKALRTRGYNQALELARPVARRLGVPIDLNCCRRTRATESQSSLTARERRKNVRGCFRVERLSARHVAIVDDVVTTGSTAGELARALLRAGAERVELWALARAGGG